MRIETEFDRIAKARILGMGPPLTYDGYEAIDPNFVEEQRRVSKIRAEREQLIREGAESVSPQDQSASGMSAKEDAADGFRRPIDPPSTTTFRKPSDLGVRSVVEAFMSAVTDRLNQLPQQEYPVPTLLQPIMLESHPPALREVFRDSVWNRRRLQSTLVVLFLLSTVVFGLLWLTQRRSEPQQQDDNQRLEVSTPNAEAPTFRVLGSFDKKIYLRNSTNFDWFDLDPFDPEPKLNGYDGVLRSLHRVVDPTTGRDSFVMQFVADFEGFVELYHDGRQIIIMRLHDADIPETSSPKQIKIWLQERSQQASAEANRLFAKLPQTKNDVTKQDAATAKQQRAYNIAISRQAAFGYAVRRIDEAPHLFLWSHMNKDD